MQIQDGQLVAFLGDSITEHLAAVSAWMETQSDGLTPVGTTLRVDRHEHRGWTTILANRIHLSYPERRIRYLNAGVGGHSSRQMRERFADGILAHQPHWLFLSAGVVEVRREYQPDRASERVAVDEYRTHLTWMVNGALNANIRVVLLEPTPHARPVTGGPPEATLAHVHSLTERYVTGMRQVAHDTGAGFVPLFEAFLEMEQRLAGNASLYADEVHLSPLGDMLYSQHVFDYLDR